MHAPRDTPESKDERKHAFIEEMGRTLSEFGLPLMASRILAALLVATPPEQSASDLARTLGASRGSISTMTRLLETPGLIQRVRKPGDRKVYYRNTPNGWYRAMEREAASMRSLRELAEEGAELMRDEAPEARRGIEDAVTYLAFWERELTRVLERWMAEHPRHGPPNEGGEA